MKSSSKKKAAKKQTQRESDLKWARGILRQREADLKDELRNTAAARDQLATDLQRFLAERDEARKELAEARRGREAWCHKCGRGGGQPELLLQLIDAARQLHARPSIPVTLVEAPQLAERVPAPTFGLPGDTPTTRFSREFRG